MAKVASQSWVEVARSAFAHHSTAVIHSHFLVADNLDGLEQKLAVPGDRQTIADLLLPRDMVSKGRAAAAAVAKAYAEGAEIRLVCGMRDPVERSLSLFSFLADFCRHRNRSFCGRDPHASVEVVIRALTSAWEGVYSADEPDESFEWLLHRLVGLFRNWFTEELLGPFEVDVRDSPLPAHGGPLLLRNGRVEVLVYRVEDMAPSAPGYKRLLAAAGDFLGKQLLTWPKINSFEGRLRSQPFNQRVRQQFRLPSDLVDAIYNEPIVRHLYRPSEIATFRSRWSVNGHSISPVRAHETSHTSG